MTTTIVQFTECYVKRNSSNLFYYAFTDNQEFFTTSPHRQVEGKEVGAGGAGETACLPERQPVPAAASPSPTQLRPRMPSVCLHAAHRDPQCLDPPPR